MSFLHEGRVFISTNFSRSLSFLRQEKRVSQRIAAKELGISQALLSHYENGIREPGLNFVLRACEYYNVSSDFILGRTLSRDGTVILNADSLLDSSQQREGAGNSDSLALLSRKLISNSVDLVFGLLAKTGNDAAIRAACNYLGTAVYTLFRHLYQADGTNSQDIFSVPVQKFAQGAGKADLIYSEMEYVEALMAHAREKGSFPELNNEALTRYHAAMYQSLLQIIHITGERITRQVQVRKEDRFHET